jgi:hypothetical protein
VKGKIILGNRDKKVTLEPKGLLNLEVRAKKKNGRVKITIKCGWKDEKEGSELKIDSLVSEGAKK